MRVGAAALAANPGGAILGGTLTATAANGVAMVLSLTLDHARSGLVPVIGGGVLPTAGDAGGAGASLDLFAIDGSGRPSRLGGSSLPPHSRTGALAVDRRNIYVGVPATQDRQAEVRGVPPSRLRAV